MLERLEDVANGANLFGRKERRHMPRLAMVQCSVVRCNMSEGAIIHPDRIILLWV